MSVHCFPNAVFLSGSVLLAFAIVSSVTLAQEDLPQEEILETDEVNATLALTLDELAAFRLSREIARPELVSRYVDLVKQHSGEPQVAKVMYELAIVFEVQAPQMGYSWDKGMAIDWYRKSYSNSETDSAMRQNAGLRLANRLRNRGTSEDVKEARRVLDAVAIKSDDSESQVLTEELLKQAIAERNFDEAERFCRSKLDSNSIDMGQKMFLAKELVEAWPDSSGSYSQKKDWINNFSARYAHLPLLKQSSSLARGRLESLSGKQLERLTTKTLGPARGRSQASLLIVANLCVILIVAGILLVRKFKLEK